MLKEKISSRMIDNAMKVFSSLGFQTSRNIEYTFALNHISSETKLLDVGSTGSLFPLKLAKKGHMVYSIDTRKYHEKHPNLTFINTDIKKTSFQDNFFDLITCISTIEHIGLSAYGDPKYDEGDKLAINEFKRILKRNGKLIITTPFAGEYTIMPLEKSHERIYNYDKLMTLFKGWEILKEEFYIPKSKKNWIQTTRDNANKSYNSHPRSNLSCFVLRRN